VAIAAVPKGNATIPVRECKAVNEGDECGEDSYCVLDTEKLAIICTFQL